MAMVSVNILRVKDRIAATCRRIGRDPREITVVAVTKFATQEMVQEALANGVTHIAENKVQQAVEKYTALKSSDTPITKHMIGHLQTNKVKQALQVFDVIQSVDSPKLAKVIGQRAGELDQRAEIFIQVNTSGETQKYGIKEEEAIPLVQEISGLKNVFVAGLMTIAPFTEDEQVIRDCFRKLRCLRDKIARGFTNHPNIDMKYLSMGMTADYTIALEEGSNMVRIGTAIFHE